MEHAISSGIGALVAETVTMLLCTIKTNKVLYNSLSISHIIKNIYNTRGIIGFFGGTLPAIISQVIFTLSKYTIYKYIQKVRDTNKQDIFNNMINGACGGIVGGFMSHPFDVMKVIKQNKRTLIPSSSFNNQSITNTFSTKIMY
jgi:uncharacterized membrane protein YeaQ/YmgE (transglycosylase-associated protein family)